MRLSALVSIPVLAAALAACGSSQRVGGADRDDAIVYIKSNVRDAGMWIDGVYIGGLDSLRGGVAIDAGPHRVEVRHDDYFAYYEELQLTAGERKKLEVELSPILP